jgi:cobalt-zinc-cadmium efflux system outer membrane protein
LSRFFLPWLLLATTPGWAQGAGTDPLSLPAAAERVLQHNPRLQGAEFGRAAAATLADAAALKPQWSVGLDVEDILGNGPLSGVDSAESTLRLSRIFQPTAIRSERLSVATAISSRAELELEAERLDVMTRLARRFLAVAYAQENLALASESVGLWERARDLAITRERAGAAPAVDRLRSEIRIANAELELEDAGHQLDSARMTLAASWAATKPDFRAVAANLCELVPLPGFDGLAARIDRNPGILLFATEQRVLEAEARLANARQRPAWTVSAGIRHMAASDDQAFVLGFSVPLGSQSRAEPDIRRANALRRQSEFEEQDVRVSTRALLYQLFQEVQHAAHEVRSFDDDILPRSATILEEIETGYRLGRYTHLELVSAQAELLTAGSARLAACNDHHELLIDIERLTGGGAWLVADTGVSQ